MFLCWWYTLTLIRMNIIKLGGIFYWGIMIKKLRMNINIQNTTSCIYKYLGEKKGQQHSWKVIHMGDRCCCGCRSSLSSFETPWRQVSPPLSFTPRHFIWKQHYPNMWSRGDSLCPLAGFDFSFLKHKGVLFCVINKWKNMWISMLQQLHTFAI